MVILIVDGSSQVIDRLASLLTEPGKKRTIHKAGSYMEATTLFKEKQPALVLLDRYLPNNESIELLKAIKTANRNTKVIILYFFADGNIESQYKLHGADFFLDKYNDFDKIPGIIDSITL